MEKKLTALEWLANDLKQNHGVDLTLYSEFEQAKEMEKQQIIDACYFGSQNLPYEIKDKSEQYYKETFKSK
jgi:hypothetical protein